MRLEAFLRAEARTDLQVAAAWYEERTAGLGGEFIDEFLACIDRVEENPESYAAVDRDIRRALLHRFPYAIFYVVEPSHVEVLGLMQCHQHPSIWRTRA